MAIKCKWCQDTGKYYPLQGPAEPCRECAAANTVTFRTHLSPVQAFVVPPIDLPAPPLQTIGAISVSQIAQTLMVMDLTPEQCDIIRDNIPYSGQGFDVCRRTAYIATWKEHAQQILDLLEWNALDTTMRGDGEHWVMEHKPGDTNGVAVKDTRCIAVMNGERCLFKAVPNLSKCRFHGGTVSDPENHAVCRP